MSNPRFKLSLVIYSYDVPYYCSVRSKSAHMSSCLAKMTSKCALSFFNIYPWYPSCLSSSSCGPHSFLKGASLLNTKYVIHHNMLSM